MNNCKICNKETSNKTYCSYTCKAKAPRSMRGEYIFRKLTSGNKTGDAYGITIPAMLVMKHNLLGKKFKIKVTDKGKFIMYTKT